MSRFIEYLQLFPPGSSYVKVTSHKKKHLQRGGDFFKIFQVKGELVGGFNPSEKYDSQNGNLPQIGVNIKHIWNHQLGKINRQSF